MGIVENLKESVEKQIEKKKTEKLIEDIAINAFLHLASHPYEEEIDVEKLQKELEDEGLNYCELREMSLKERSETINSMGLCYEDYEELFWDCNNGKTEEELIEALADEGLTFEGLCRMDWEKRKEVIEVVGLDYDDYEALFEDYDNDMSYYSTTTYDYEYNSTDLYDYETTSKENSIVKEFCKRHIKAIIIIVLVMLILLGLTIAIIYLKKLIPVGYDADELEGEYWEEVVEELEDEGFTKVSSEAIYDLEYEDISKEGEVCEVIIKGEAEFSEDDKYPYDTKINIRYHMLRLLELPFTHKEAKKLDYLEASEKLREAGFVNIKLEPIKDLVLGWITKEGEIEKVTVGGLEKYSTEDVYRPDVEIIVYYHVFKDK